MILLELKKKIDQLVADGHAHIRLTSEHYTGAEWLYGGVKVDLILFEDPKTGETCFEVVCIPE